MKKIPLLLLTSSILAACGGGSGGSSDPQPLQEDPTTNPDGQQGGQQEPEEKTEPEQVTSNNISDAISIPNAQQVEVSSDSIPDSLDSVDSSNVESVVVTANSNYQLALSVPEDQVPSGKKVGGYIIELPDSSQLFIPAQQSSSQASAFTTSSAALADTKKSKATKYLRPAITTLESPVINENTAMTGTTEVTIQGWSIDDFNLESSLEDLKLRIYPLLVNESITTVDSIDDIDLTDESNWVGIQELALNVEAVATAPIQISLTWNTQTDLDLWVVEPNSNKIYYADTLSKSSLGWLDYDNTEAYGPENITFQYQMPEGEYKVFVHYFDGDADTDYSVVVAQGDEVDRYTGSFDANQSNGNADEDLNADDASVDAITTINVDSTLNATLSAKVPLNQYTGTWKLPEESSSEGYLVIRDDLIIAYYLETYQDTTRCIGYPLSISYLPTGMRIENGQLQASDAFFADIDEESFTYRYLTLGQATLPENCTIAVADNDDEDNEGSISDNPEPIEIN